MRLTLATLFKTAIFLCHPTTNTQVSLIYFRFFSIALITYRMTNLLHLLPSSAAITEAP